MATKKVAPKTPPAPRRRAAAAAKPDEKSAIAQLLPNPAEAPAQETPRAPRSKPRMSGHTAASRRGAKVRIGVDERRTGERIAAAVSDEAARVGSAGDAFVPASDAELPDGEGDNDAGGSTDRLTGDGVAVILKALFKGIALVTRDDYYAIEDMEIDEITEPIARQVNRIPIVAELIDQNVADYIAIGAGAAALIGDRLQHFNEVQKDREARRTAHLRGREPIVDVEAKPSPAAAAAEPAPSSPRWEETATLDHRVSGDVHQEIRESRGPSNLEAFRVAS